MKKIILMMSLLLLFVVSCGKEFSVDAEGKGNVPKFELKELNSGKIVNSEKIMNNGKKTLIVVAAEWCPHCKEELPEVQKFYDANKDKVNVVVVFTNSQTNLGKTQTYVKDNGYTFPAYFDENGAITRGFAVDGFPYNLKITNGKVEEKLELPVDFDSLTASFSK